MKLFIQLGWFFSQKWKKYLIAITILIFIAFLQLIPPKLVGSIVDDITKNQIQSELFKIKIVMILCIALLIYFLRYLWRILLFGTAYRLAEELREKLYILLSKQLPNFYVSQKTGDLMARATNDVEKVVFAAGEGVLTLVDSLFIGCSVLLIMGLKISWRLTALVLLPMLVMSVFIKKYGRSLHRRFYSAQSAFSTLNNQVQEDLTHIRMIKAFGLEEYQSIKFISLSLEISKKNMKVTKIGARFDPIIYLSVGISNLLAVVIGGWFITYQKITIGQLTSFIMYLGLMIWPMLALAWMFNILERGRAAYERIYQTLQNEKEIKRKTISLPKGIGKLEIKIKHFRYPESKNMILRNISFSIQPGQMFGICGPTGSGKSTLLSLILRNLETQIGSIIFHGFPIHLSSIDQWRNRISVVSQTPFLFSDSILKNISFGNPNASIKQIENAAKLASIHNDILKFPNGYQTKTGEKGIALSGGQKQRIALARAFLLKTDILILDNALSSLDVQTERKILNNLNIWTKNRIVIIASNKISVLKNSNEIIVLKNGYIDQMGSHFFLLNQSGWYQNMYKYQEIERSLK